MKRYITFMAALAVLMTSQVEAHSSKQSSAAAESKAHAVTTSDKRVEVKDYWARPGKQGQNTAAYMVLTNHGDQEGISLVEASSPLCREVQIHTTLEEEIDGHAVKKMRQVENINLPCHQDVALKPGGYHVMMIGLNEDVKLDKASTAPLILVFSNGEKVELTLPIKKSPCSCCEEAAKKKVAAKKAAAEREASAAA